MVLWRTPPECNYDPLEKVDFPPPRFYTLNYTTYKKQEWLINYSFQLWLSQLLHSTRSYMCIPHQVVRKYKHLIFHVYNHNVFILPNLNVEFVHETLPFCIMEDDLKETTTD